MRRALRLLAVVLGLVAIAAIGLLVAVAVAPWPAMPEAGAAARPVAAKDLVVGGFFHVHTTASHDGRGTLDEAVGAARSLGARFLVRTEHEVLAPAGPEVRGGVLVLPAVELSAEAGHVIAIGPRGLPAGRGPGVVAEIAALGGDAVIAHPVNLRRPWTGSLDGPLAGFEGLSLDSAFREATARRSPRLVLAAAAALSDPRKAGALLLRRPDEALRTYDELAASRPLALVCGVDAHGMPPYEASFGAWMLQVRLPAEVATALEADPVAAAAAIRAAIREGRSFCSVPALGDGASFRLELEEADGARAVVASVAGQGTTIVLLRDGVEVARRPGPALRLEGPAAGAYRAEVLASPGWPWEDDSLWITGTALGVP